MNEVILIRKRGRRWLLICAALCCGIMGACIWFQINSRSQHRRSEACIHDDLQPRVHDTLQHTVDIIALCGARWKSFDVVLGSSIDQLVIYEAVVVQYLSLEKNLAMLRVTALLFDPENPHLVKGKDHLGFSPRVEAYVSTLSCLVRGVETPLEVRYYGESEPVHDVWNKGYRGSSLAPKGEDTLMILQCPLPGLFINGPEYDDDVILVQLQHRDPSTRHISYYSLDLCHVSGPNHDA